jgi:hypothetical protein
MRMPNDLKPLLDGLDRMRSRALDGASLGIDTITPALTDELRASAPHGDDTGATAASYNVRRVGRGESGQAAFQAAQAAAESRNPGHSASSPLTLGAPLGAIADSGTDYQSLLEEARAGENATLTPFVATMGTRLTRAAAAGSKRALS